MKQGKSLMELGGELQRQRKSRKDFIADSRSLKFHTQSNGISILRISTDNKNYEFVISDIAHLQIASHLNIPARYYKKMQTDSPQLLDHNVNTLLETKSERRLIRTLDGKVRAFLSDHYRCLDNLELCAAVLPVVQEMKGATIASCDLTSERLYLKVINKRLKAEVDKNDMVQAGYVVSNSEVGLGSLSVEPLIYRQFYKNGLICKEFSIKKYHVGRPVHHSDADAYELYSESIVSQDDRAFFKKVQDVVRAAIDESKFQLILNKLRQAKQIPLAYAPIKVVQSLADNIQLSQQEQKQILHQLLLSGDYSRYGLMNAVTTASQLSTTYERATELERIGGEILSMNIPRHLITTHSSHEDIMPALATA